MRKTTYILGLVLVIVGCLFLNGIAEKVGNGISTNDGTPLTDFEFFGCTNALASSSNATSIFTGKGVLYSILVKKSEIEATSTITASNSAGTTLFTLALANNASDTARWGGQYQEAFTPPYPIEFTAGFRLATSNYASCPLMALYRQR